MEYTLDENRANEAYGALVKYLAICQRSEKECIDKLYSKGYHKNEVEFAISKAKSYRYIDDAEYVRNFLIFNKNKYGIKKLSYKLVSEKGVDKTLVQNCIADFIPDEEETEICREFAEKYAKQKRIEDKAGIRKLSAFLYQKGFEWGVINSVVYSLFDVEDESV
ncbi:MAG: recombination regulator RecX [Bacteroides sp.]|nr:recombination regulator RecX [Bacillota bacterium]MCM1394300.1 recombination regulator RecX [[Eubacterium] siraeum]MCM1455616.1 recombination regulator RecX [Bacteroides sp.]